MVLRAALGQTATAGVRAPARRTWLQMGADLRPALALCPQEDALGTSTPLTGQQATLANRAFYASPEEVAGLRTVAQGPTAGRERGRLLGMGGSRGTAWRASTRTRAASSLPGNAPWNFGWLGMDQRFALENFRAALDAPGEWFLDRDGTLSYIPPPRAGHGRRPRLVAPVAEQFIQLTRRRGGRGLRQSTSASGTSTSATRATRCRRRATGTGRRWPRSGRPSWPTARGT